MKTPPVSSEEIEKSVGELPRKISKSRFAAKILASIRKASKCEEFNVWHANADNVKHSGPDLAWGTLPRRTSET